MQKYKDVCGEYDEVWFEVFPSNHKKFLKWVKDLGCVWLNGETINPSEKVNYTHFAIDTDGKFGVVPISLWISKDFEFKKVKRYKYCKFIKDVENNPFFND